MDIKERIEKAKERLEAAKNAKTKAETQLEAAQEQCDKVVEEMKQLGVTPDTIEAETPAFHLHHRSPLRGS